MIYRILKMYLCSRGSTLYISLSGSDGFPSRHPSVEGIDNGLEILYTLGDKEWL